MSENKLTALVEGKGRVFLFCLEPGWNDTMTSARHKIPKKWREILHSLGGCYKIKDTIKKSDLWYLSNTRSKKVNFSFIRSYRYLRHAGIGIRLIRKCKGSIVLHWTSHVTTMTHPLIPCKWATGRVSCLLTMQTTTNRNVCEHGFMSHVKRPDKVIDERHGGAFAFEVCLFLRVRLCIYHIDIFFLLTTRED